MRRHAGRSSTTSHRYRSANTAPVSSSSDIGRIQKPAPCKLASRLSPSQPITGTRSQNRRGGASGCGRDQGLIGRGFQARR